MSFLNRVLGRTEAKPAPSAEDLLDAIESDHHNVAMKLCKSLTTPSFANIRAERVAQAYIRCFNDQWLPAAEFLRTHASAKLKGAASVILKPLARMNVESAILRPEMQKVFKALGNAITSADVLQLAKDLNFDLAVEVVIANEELKFTQADIATVSAITHGDRRMRAKLVVLMRTRLDLEAE